MTNAGDGDGNRLRIGGWVPDTEVDRVDAVAGEVLPPTRHPGAPDDDVWDPPPSDVRDGPTAEPNDSWDKDSWDKDSWDTGPEGKAEGETYRGRRRLSSPTLRLWLVIAFVLLGLGAAVAIPIALSLSSEDDAQPDAGAPSVAPNIQSPTDGSASPTTTPGPSASPSPSRPATVAARPFRPVTYEAEARANVREGTARIRNTSGASGRKVVNRIGDWSDSETTEANNGTLTFTEVTVPASGTYTIAIYYAFLDEGATRSMLITVNQGAPRSVTFARPEGCCESSVTLSVPLQKGVNAIRFSNPDGPAPAIDRIVIRQP